jgi:hypothetical protein
MCIKKMTHLIFIKMKTKKMIDSSKLKKLYSETSKHSNYQIIPDALKSILSNSDIEVKTRQELERMNFLRKYLNFKGKKILDVGGNTGYFSFESIEEEASEVVYIEGNEAHAIFVEEASKQLNKNIKVYNKYLDFQEPIGDEPFNTVLLFNVIHHLGDDYGDKNITISKAKQEMVHCINYFHDKTELLVLQMGFCWQGDISKLLFKNGTKSEMIEFVKNAVNNKWDILEIGIAEEINDKTIYKPLNESNIERFDGLGEFRNRPIFILKKK